MLVLLPIGGRLSGASKGLDRYSKRLRGAVRDTDGFFINLTKNAGKAKLAERIFRPLIGLLRIGGGVATAIGAAFSIFSGFRLVQQINDIKQAAEETDNFAESIRNLIAAQTSDAGRRGIITPTAYSEKELSKVQDRIKSVQEEITRLKSLTPLNITERDANLDRIQQLETILSILNKRASELSAGRKVIPESDTRDLRNFALELVEVQYEIIGLRDGFRELGSSETLRGLNQALEVGKELQTTFR